MQARVALSNQLRAELERFWPGPIGLFTDLDSPISLAFLERYPSPADARGLGEQRLQAFLARQRYSGGQKPARLFAKLPGARARAVSVAGGADHPDAPWCSRFVAAVEALVSQDQHLDQRITTAVREHQTARSFLSLPQGSVISRRPRG